MEYSAFVAELQKRGFTFQEECWMRPDGAHATEHAVRDLTTYHDDEIHRQCLAHLDRGAKGFYLVMDYQATPEVYPC